MMEDSQQLDKLRSLPLEERLRLARWLIETAIQSEEGISVEARDQGTNAANTLLALAGRYSGGPGDTAERDEDILESGINATEGLSVQ